MQINNERLNVVLSTLKHKHSKLESLHDCALKDLVKVEILAIEDVLRTLRIDFKSCCCYKCGEPDTAAKDERERYICWECMMKE